MAGLATALAVGVAGVIAWRVFPLVSRLRRFDGSEIVEIFESQAGAEKDIARLAATARSVDVLTVRGLGIIGLNDSVLRKQLFESPGPRQRIRVLLLSPKGKNAHVRAAEVGESTEAFIHGINLAIQRMRELEALGIHDLEVYLYDRRPCWRVIALDDSYFVSVFGSRVEGHRALMYWIDGSKRSTFYDAISRMFEDMCATGERII